MKTRQIVLVVKFFVGIGAFLASSAASSAAAEANITERRRRTAAGDADGVEAARPLAIVIMAVGRSGSSMVGEFFRQSEDILYFYEPCRRAGDKSGLECLALVQRLTQCKFSVEDSEFLASDRNAVLYGSQELKPLLAYHGTEQFAQAHEQLIDTCTHRRAVAVKSIRLPAGLGGEDFQVPGLKVLHLVRDPRGVVQSQLKHLRTPWAGGRRVDHTSKAYNGGVSICGTYRVQLDSSDKLEESRYLLLRYEDIATTPELAVTLIYYWSGLGPLPSDVKKWIEVNTRIADCDGGDAATRHLQANPEEHSFGYAYATPEYPSTGPGEIRGFMRADQSTLGIAKLGASEASAVSSKTNENTGGLGGRSIGSPNGGRNLVECLDNAEEALQNAQGTKRDSAAMASMWRTTMPEEEARAVWEACQDSGVMAALGYYL